MTLGIAITAYNHPHYLREMLRTLAANDLSGCDVHLWQDGPHTPDMAQAVEQSVAAFESAALPGAVVHRNEHNLCCAGQRYQIMPWMAARYPWFICADNDIALGRWAIRHMRTLFGQFEADATVGSISPGCKLLREPPERYKASVMVSGGHFWCEGWWSEKWERLWPWYEQYYAIMGRRDYRRLIPQDPEINAWAAGIGSRYRGPSSDEALARMLEMGGMSRLRMVVNRATGTGDHGLHMTPALMAELGAGHQPIYEWDDEEGIDRFEVIGEETT